MNNHIIFLTQVRDMLPDLITSIRKVAGHSRILGISAATGERVAELMQRVRKLVDSLPAQGEMELFTDEVNRVNFDEEISDAFEILTDENFPGQFRVVGEKIEKVSFFFLFRSLGLFVDICLYHVYVPE